MAQPKQPADMTLMETVSALVSAEREHDLDCEEGVGSDRCPRCLAEALGDKVQKVQAHVANLDESLRAIEHLMPRPREVVGDDDA